MRLVLIGDGESPHLLKWARALSSQVELWAASTRGFLPGFDAVLPLERRLALNTVTDHAGGNIAVLKALPRLGAWLKVVDADWLHAHYLTSHGTLAWAAKRGWGLRAQIAGSAWGSDILVTPRQGRAYRWLTRRVLRACALTTSDSQHMTSEMRALGAGEVMTFPFGLEQLPPPPPVKQPWLFFTNRGLEPIYQPQRVLRLFAAIAASQAEAEFVMANDGSLRAPLQAQASALGLDGRLRFVGRLDAATQSSYYARARWYVSLPASDSVSVSVLEAMAHECLPLLSELPANHELLSQGQQGWIVPDGAEQDGVQLMQRLQALQSVAEQAGRANRDWVAGHALFGPAVQSFVERLTALQANPRGH